MSRQEPRAPAHPPLNRWSATGATGATGKETRGSLDATPGFRDDRLTGADTSSGALHRRCRSPRMSMAPSRRVGDSPATPLRPRLVDDRRRVRVGDGRSPWASIGLEAVAIGGRQELHPLHGGFRSAARFGRSAGHAGRRTVSAQVLDPGSGRHRFGARDRQFWTAALRRSPSSSGLRAGRARRAATPPAARPRSGVAGGTAIRSSDGLGDATSTLGVPIAALGSRHPRPRPIGGSDVSRQALHRRAGDPADPRSRRRSHGSPAVRSGASSDPPRLAIACGEPAERR